MIRTACVASALMACSLATPCAQAAPRPPAPPTTPAEPLDVQFEPDAPGVALLMADGLPPFVRLEGGRRWRPRIVVRTYATACLDACLARFIPGTYDLALERGTQHTAGAKVTLTRPSILRGHYADRSGVRTAGLILAMGGAVAGSAMMIGAVHRRPSCDGAGDCPSRAALDSPLFFAGLGVFTGSLVGGFALTRWRDEALFTIAPLVSSVTNPRDRSRPALPEGVAVSVTF